MGKIPFLKKLVSYNSAPTIRSTWANQHFIDVFVNNGLTDFSDHYGLSVVRDPPPEFHRCIFVSRGKMTQRQGQLHSRLLLAGRWLKRSLEISRSCQPNRRSVETLRQLTLQTCIFHMVLIYLLGLLEIHYDVFFKNPLVLLIINIISKCIEDDTKAGARQSPNCIRKNKIK